ncbi:MAG: extracellular solute-binding protein [Candidatus Portnoybacteria bacterium]|nr:extracellular solute-binding protein [Candidatus Portnoybacteria bacterium]
MTRKQLLIISGGVLAIIIVLIIFGLIKNPRPTPAHLEIWSVYEDRDDIKELIEEYEDANSHIKIEFKEKSFETYEEELINAFAADRGPDIWMMHNTWLAKHQDKIKKMPSDLMSLAQLRQRFVDIIEFDMVRDGDIYGLPLYVDTLALFYNKDLLNSAGISSPPKTWKEVVEYIPLLVKKNRYGDIEQAGAALGTAENINRSVDVLYLLMLQNGTNMVDKERKSVDFDKSISLDGETYYPGRDSLRFYADFSDPSNRVYTWNRQMPYSVDAFVEGDAAIMFNYSHHISTIREKAPYLNFSVSSMPQIENSKFDINYGNYWAYTVSKKTKAYNEAWKFILYLTQERNAKRYLENSGRPTAHRSLVDWQKEDLDLSVFAKQSLSARSWYQADSEEIENIFIETIKDIVLGRSTVAVAIKKAADKVTLLLDK